MLAWLLFSDYFILSGGQCETNLECVGVLITVRIALRKVHGPTGLHLQGAFLARVFLHEVQEILVQRSVPAQHPFDLQLHAGKKQQASKRGQFAYQRFSTLARDLLEIPGQSLKAPPTQIRVHYAKEKVGGGDE